MPAYLVIPILLLLFTISGCSGTPTKVKHYYTETELSLDQSIMIQVFHDDSASMSGGGSLKGKLWVSKINGKTTPWEIQRDNHPYEAILMEPTSLDLEIKSRWFREQIVAKSGGVREKQWRPIPGQATFTSQFRTLPGKKLTWQFKCDGETPPYMAYSLWAKPDDSSRQLINAIENQCGLVYRWEKITDVVRVN